MGIIFKFIIKNIKEKKFRTFLILLSVVLSTALFFASIAISGTIQKMFLERMKKYIGTSDIVVHANEKSPSWLFTIRNSEPIKKDIIYQVGTVETSGSYRTKQETVNIDLKGYQLMDLKRMNPFMLKIQQHFYPFAGRKIVLSQSTATKYNLKLGQHLDLLFGNIKHRFLIVGIAQPMGLFQEDGRSNTALVPYSTLAGLVNGNGKVSVLYIKLKDPSQVAGMIERLSKMYRRYTVREPISRQEINQHISRITTPFMLMLTLVLFMSVFIIYTSFKVITRERLPIIGTFRSIGATKKMTDLVLFAESVFYGVIGGFCGCFLGIGILYVMTIMMTPQWMVGIKTTVEFSFGQLLLSFTLGVILALVSSLIPIIKISKIPVKDIILNTIERSKKKRKYYKLILGILSLGIAYLLPLVTPKQVALVFSLCSMILSVAAVILLVPYATKGFIKLFERIFLYIFGNEGILAVKNLRDNKSILNNISLLAIGISSLLMINTISYSVAKEVLNVWRDFKFDIWMGYGGLDRSLESVIRSVKGVKSTYGLYEANRVELPDYQDRISWIQGANPGKYLDYMDVPLPGDRQELLRQLDQGRNIIISQSLGEKLNLHLGQQITLKMKRGNKFYKIIAFFDTLMDNGSFGIISERYLKLDMMLPRFYNLYIRTTEDPDVVRERLRKKFQQERPWFGTVREMTKQNMDSNQQMFLILQGFSMLALIIGIFGVFNNLIISFIERQRSLAVMRSVGMGKKQTIKMIFIESFTGGLIGGSVGIIAGLFLLTLVPNVIKTLNLNLTIHYSPAQFILAVIAGIVITVVASISPAFKSSKLDIIEAIKYE